MDERIAGGRVGRIAWIVGGLAALLLAGIAATAFAPAGALAEALPLLLSIAAVAAGVGAFQQGVLLRRRAEKASGEMDELSARLLRIDEFTDATSRIMRRIAPGRA
jgi:hypothetical protein